MEITVVFTTQLKAAIGKSADQVELPELATVRQVIDALAESYPSEFAQMVLDEDQRLLPSVLLCVDDRQVDEATTLEDGDTVTILSAISGG